MAQVPTSAPTANRMKIALTPVPTLVCGELLGDRLVRVEAVENDVTRRVDSGRDRARHQARETGEEAAVVAGRRRDTICHETRAQRHGRRECPSRDIDARHQRIAQEARKQPGERADAHGALARGTQRDAEPSGGERHHDSDCEIGHTDVTEQHDPDDEVDERSSSKCKQANISGRFGHLRRRMTSTAVDCQTGGMPRAGLTSTLRGRVPAGRVCC